MTPSDKFDVLSSVATALVLVNCFAVVIVHYLTR